MPIGLEDNGSNVLLVFQAPGDVEWVKGLAIQPTQKVGGSAGRRIELSWGRTNQKRTNFDIINTVQCFPGNNNNRDLEPNVMAICSCSKRLNSILIKKQYNKIITFGEIANEVVLVILQNITNNKPIIIKSKHPNGGVSQQELDKLW